MRRYLAFTALGIAVVGLAWIGVWLAGPEPVAAARGSSMTPPGVGAQFAGAWLCYNYVGDSDVGTPLLVTVNGDGTLLICNSFLPGSSAISTIQGAWKPAGKNAMVGTIVCIVTTLDGSVNFYEKGTLAWTLTEDGNKLEGTSWIGIYAPYQDPLQEAPEWGEATCTATGRRIVAE